MHRPLADEIRPKTLDEVVKASVICWLPAAFCAV